MSPPGHLDLVGGSGGSTLPEREAERCCAVSWPLSCSRPAFTGLGEGRLRLKLAPAQC